MPETVVQQGEAYEQISRLKKAEVLVTLCQEFNITVEQIDQLSREQWAMLSRLGMVNYPSTETKALVKQMLAQRVQLIAVVRAGKKGTR